MTQSSKILVAIDFSENSDRALDTAIDLAPKFGASIDLVHALNFPMPGLSPYEISAPEDYMRACRNSAKEALEKTKARVHEAGITVRTHLVDAPASGALCRVAEECGSDLLVMGTRGHSGVKHILMGSVAEHTLRHAPCNVLIVR
jgi:nucleotide-binding universal stress UspA family protein